MGIKNLTTLIKSKSPDSIETKGLYTFKDKTIAVDASILIYKSLTNVRSGQSYLTNKEGKIVSHIIGLFYKVVLFKSFGIIPIFVFDGKPPEEKREVLMERNKKVTESKELIKQTDDMEKKQKLEKATVRIKKEHIEDLKKLFDLMGVKYVHPNCEAETYAAHLCKQNVAYGVYSEDMDTLAFGSPYLIRNCIDKSIKRKDVVSVFSLETILSDFKMNYEQFVEMCILCGCDYCGTIPKIGSVRAYQSMITHQTGEKIIMENKNTPPDYLEKFNKAKSLFIEPKFDDYQIISTTRNDKKLGEFLINDCNMSINRVQNALKKINKFI